MKVAHLNNPANVAGIIAERQGAQVFVFNHRSKRLFPQSTFVTRYDPLKYNALFRRIANEFDLLHYHYPYGRVFTAWRLGVKFRFFEPSARILWHFHGSDLRGRGGYDRFCIVSTPDLLKLAPEGEWLPNPIPVNEFTNPYSERENPKPKIIYYPDFTFKKGVQDYITKPLNEMQARGKCTITATLKFSYEELLEQIASSDIVIGKLRPDMGWFGKFELEAMALKRPVMAYISDELFEKYRPPVFRTSPATFKRDLEILLEDRREQRRLSEEGRRYVEEHHDVERVMEKLEEYYHRV